MNIFETIRFALRASVQNGFKAPSLQQQYFATTSTNFINGVPFDIQTFPVTDPVAQALGAKPLDAEESLNYSIGAVARVGDWPVLKLDPCHQAVLLRQMVEEEARPLVAELLRALEFRVAERGRPGYGVGGVRPGSPHRVPRLHAPVGARGRRLPDDRRDQHARRLPEQRR